MSMKILLTGATGFAGASVLPALLDAGHTVHVLARASSISRLPRNHRSIPFAGDALDRQSVAAALAGCDAVVHLIGTKREAIKRTGLSYDDVDVGSVRVMVDAMKGAGVARILLLSAGAIGQSVYVKTKARAERLVVDAGLAWTIFRPSFILGPGQQWPRILEPALALVGLLPGHIGDVARRARAVRRDELARSMVWSLDHAESIGAIYDVPAIRRLGKLATGAADKSLSSRSEAATTPG
jgi:nucleoside-diphosphate-sugar epimerase